MSNRFHNKFHRHNHHTTPTDRGGLYPDSAYDPIASRESPFRGEFYIDGNITSLSSLSALGTIAAQNIVLHGDLSIGGSLTVLGEVTQLDTIVQTTSAFTISNHGTSIALRVIQDGFQPIAYFTDVNGDPIIFDIDGKVGIGTAFPTSKLTVVGDIKGNNLLLSENINTSGNLIEMNSSSTGATFRINSEVGGNSVIELNNGPLNDSSGPSVNFQTNSNTFARIHGLLPLSALSFTTVGVERMRIDSAGNVGIGTTTPRGSLDIGGGSLHGISNIYGHSSAGSYGIYSNPANSNDGAWIQMYGSTNVNDPSTIHIGSNGVEIVRITPDGNIGIGTTSPADKLTVVGNTSFGGIVKTGNNVSTEDCSIEIGANRTDTGNAYVDLHSTVGSNYEARFSRTSGANGNTTLAHTGTGNFNILTENAAPLQFSTSNAEQMRITPAGDVGIGTTSPGYKLDVAGTKVRVSNSSYPAYIANNTSETNWKSGIIFQSSGTNKWEIGTDVSAVGNNNLFFYDNAAGATRLQIDDSGNVGIGTSTPGTKLDVVGQIRGTSNIGGLIASNAADSQTSLWLHRQGAVTDRKTWELIQFDEANDGAFAIRTVNDDYNSSDNVIVVNRQTTGHGINSVQFGTNFTTRMTIISSGEIGIGTDVPNKTLTVIGDISSANVIWDGSGGNSTNWNSVYSTVNANSANNSGVSSLYDTVSSLSANWNSVYTTVNTNSAANSLLINSVYSTVSSVSANWNSVYTTVNTNSAANSLLINSVYSTVSSLSSAWGTGGSGDNAKYDSVYSTVSSQSAAWGTGGVTSFPKYDSVYNTVSALSSAWGSGGVMVIPKYDDLYTQVQSISSKWSNIASITYGANAVNATLTFPIGLSATDIELLSTSMSAISAFVNGVKGITYTLTNKTPSVVKIYSTPLVTVRRGSSWRANTLSMSGSFLTLPMSASCSMRADSSTVMSVW